MVTNISLWHTSSDGIFLTSISSVAAQRRQRMRANAARVKRELQLLFEVIIPAQRALFGVVGVHHDFVDDPIFARFVFVLCHNFRFSLAFLIAFLRLSMREVRACRHLTPVTLFLSGARVKICREPLCSPLPRLATDLLVAPQKLLTPKPQLNPLFSSRPRRFGAGPFVVGSLPTFQPMFLPITTHETPISTRRFRALKRRSPLRFCSPKPRFYASARSAMRAANFSSKAFAMSRSPWKTTRCKP